MNGGREDGDEPFARTDKESTTKCTRPVAQKECPDASTLKVVELPAVVIEQIQPHHLPAVRCLTKTLLPVNYPEAFFLAPTEDPVLADFCRVAVFDSKPVGWIRCRLEPPDDQCTIEHTSPAQRIYIQALCLLAPFRGQGTATALLEHVMEAGRRKVYHVHSVDAHVWESNDDALAWYEKRGFRRVQKIERYYRRLRPPGAWLVRKNLVE